MHTACEAVIPICNERATVCGVDGKMQSVLTFSDLASEKLGMNRQLYCGGNSQAAVYQDST